MRKTWLIGDTHFGHIKMCEYCDRPKNFNERIIQHWQKLVSPEDLVYHLGDVYCCKKSCSFFGCLEKLPGTKILIKGNHDRENAQWYLHNGFAAVMNAVVVPVKILLLKDQLIGKKVLFSHKPVIFDVDYCGGIDFSIHAHSHTISSKKYDPKLNGSITHKSYLFSLEHVKYKPVLLERLFVDNLIIPDELVIKEKQK